MTVGITQESQDDPRAELFDPDEDCSRDESAGGDPRGSCAITPTCTLRCHIRHQEGEAQLNDAIVDSAAEWSCPGCGYHNNGGICTHCGRPLTVTAPNPSEADR